MLWAICFGLSFIWIIVAVLAVRFFNWVTDSTYSMTGAFYWSLWGLAINAALDTTGDADLRMGFGLSALLWAALGVGWRIINLPLTKQFHFQE